MFEQSDWSGGDRTGERGRWEAISEVGEGFGELQPLVVAVLLLQSRVHGESHRGMRRVREGLILRISGRETEPVGLRCVSEQWVNSGPSL